MSLVFGLDAGGTKTVAALASPDGNIVRHWRGEGLDPTAGDEWVGRLEDIARALLPDEHAAASVLGLPFHGELANVSLRQNELVRLLFGPNSRVANDVEIALDGAFPDSDGVLVLAGTGSMAWARAGSESLRIGGWGDAIGDEGSAYWIGRQALSVATKILDGRQDDTSFAETVLSACGVPEDALIEWAYGHASPRSAYAQLAETVDAAAEAGNSTAIALLKQAAAELALHCQSARRRLQSPDLHWTFAGGVFRSRLVREECARLLGKPVAARLPPVGGTLCRAARLAGWRVGEGFINTISASLHSLGL